MTVVNRFYSMRDFNVFSQVQNTQYKATCGTAETSPCHQIITDGDTRLLDVSSRHQPDDSGRQGRLANEPAGRG